MLSDLLSASVVAMIAGFVGMTVMYGCVMTWQVGYGDTPILLASCELCIGKANPMHMHKQCW